ncbi:MAG TPA: phosphohistidine phosphatase SixA [Ignavibacteria bacterium]
MNNIYIIRHGVAAELDNEIVEEGYRYLTIHGRNHCKIVALRLKDMKTHFDIILSSPIVRAVQTAEVFASALKYEGEIKTAIELIGGSTSSRFLQMLKRYSHYKNIALFGHAPDVNHFSTILINDGQSKNININFKNSSVCKIEYNIEHEKGKLAWFLNSENMKLIEPS